MSYTKIDEAITRLVDKRERITELLRRGGYTIPNMGFETSSKQPGLDFTLRVKKMRDLRIACIMDRFSYDCFAPECHLMELTPTEWKKEIFGYKPDLIFIESAWQGKDGLWYRKIAGCAEEYQEMTSYCRMSNIPIVFWNKEDPSYTDTFMAAAQQADVVFTTEIDCVERYKAILGHNNVYHLHFAAQPQIHNPIKKYERKDRFCFAGAYYHRYKERSKVFDEFSKVFIDTKGFDIYDRNAGKARPEHAFPKFYDPYIIGSLDPSEIDKAYKGYHYGINMNSITKTQTMFARRVFELLASNTIIVSNYSRGLKNYFGNLTICTDDLKTLKKYLHEYCDDELILRKYRLAGLRQVLSEHLYEDRLNYVIEKVFGKSLKADMPLITVFCFCSAAESANRMLRLYNSQSYENKRMILVCDDIVPVDDLAVLTINKNQAKERILDEIVYEGYIAVFNERDYYGRNYLIDLVLATRYGSFDVIGKASFYELNKEGSLICKERMNSYQNVSLLAKRRSIFKAQLLKNYTVLNVLKDGNINGNCFSVDEFNYCFECGDDCQSVDDLVIDDKGIPMRVITAQAEKIQLPKQEFNRIVLDIYDLYDNAKKIQGKDIRIFNKNLYLLLESTLAENVHQYVYFNKIILLSDIECEDGKLNVKFYGTGTMEVICVCIFFNKSGDRLPPCFTNLNKLMSVDIPDEAMSLQLGLRLKGTGNAQIHKIVLDGALQCSDNLGNCYLSRSNILVLTNQYPSAENLYRNMFVHRRIVFYTNAGCVCDVMRTNIYSKDGYYEFDGINVVDGQGEALTRILNSGYINTVCVHFLDIRMWTVLKEYLNRIRVLVWIHGFEIQPWWRRQHNFRTKQELEAAKKQSGDVMSFWLDVFHYADNKNLHFIFVSQQFANEVMEDYKVKLPNNAYSIIHNFIDTELFNYIPKPVDQRAKILSIKSFANRNYANDITTKAIVRLSKEEIFKNLEFFIYGDGELFEEDTALLRKFKNVHLNKRFISQSEIAELHKQCGVYIGTTRMDTQGVSRDEAMSSGLVPIVNAVAAIPEFVDDECGILVPGEDYEAVAQGVIKLYENPDLFEKLSYGAAQRVRRQTSREFTIDKEIKLIKRE